MKPISIVTVFTLVAIATAACSTNSRMVGSVLDPYCMPDGTPIYVQYANKSGTFTDTRGKRENCPWYQQSETKRER